MPDEEKPKKEGWFGGKLVEKEQTGWFGGEPLTEEEKRLLKRGNLGSSKPPGSRKPGPRPEDPGGSDEIEFKTLEELAGAWGVNISVVRAQVAQSRLPVVETKEGLRIPLRAFEAAVAHGPPTEDNPLRSRHPPRPKKET